jgi:hypothetical protein
MSQPLLMLDSFGKSSGERTVTTRGDGVGLSERGEGDRMSAGIA